MPEHEITLLIVELLALSDQYGESLWGNIDVWVGLSIGLVILSHAASNRLNWPNIATLLALYSAYSYILLQKTLQLRISLDMSRIDAIRIAEENGIQLGSLEAVSGSAGSISGGVIIFFLAGTYLSASGFLMYSYLKSKSQG